MLSLAVAALFSTERSGGFENPLPLEGGTSIGVARTRLSIFRESVTGAIDGGCGLPYIHCTMQAKNFDQLLQEYRQAIDAWVAAIRAEEALANDDHSMVEMEKWDAAGFVTHDAEAVAKKARDRYKNELRKKNYGF